MTSTDDMPWVNLTQEEVDQLRTNKQQLTEYGKQKIKQLMMNQEPYPDEMFEEAERREAANEAIPAKVSEEDFEKVMDAAERQELAKKSFEDLTRDQKIQLALEEIDWLVIGGQDGQEFYGSIQFIRKVLKSLK